MSASGTCETAGRVVAPTLEKTGELIRRWGLVLEIEWIGAMKFTTPGTWEPTLGGFLGLSLVPAQFLLKDFLLLGVAVYLLAEALRGSGFLQEGRVPTKTRSTVCGGGPQLISLKHVRSGSSLETPGPNAILDNRLKLGKRLIIGLNPARSATEVTRFLTSHT